MRTDAAGEMGLGDVGLLPKSIDNSQVVREVDPRSSRDLWLLVALVAALAGSLGLYAWPTLMMRQTGTAAEQLSRERERLVEENRKLRLEKATLEDLRRVEAIARRELGLATPEPERLVVVERPSPAPEGVVPAVPPHPPQDEQDTIVKSPIVGTYYDAPSPGEAPFVKVGDRVEPKQVLCIIESMKLMNEIEAEVAGVVTAKLVANGQPVEYGEALFGIRPL